MAIPAISSVFQMNRLAPVCIVGNLNVDLIIRNVSEMPKWGQEVIGDEHVLVSSGQAGYLAFALRGLEIPTRLIGNVGDDVFGSQIIKDLQACGVDTLGIEISQGYPTGITVAIVRRDGERAFVTNLGSMTAFSLGMAARTWQKTDGSELVCLVGIFMLSGLGLDGCRDLLGRARAEGKLTMLDTGWDPANWPEPTRTSIQALLSDVTIFLPNLDEARAITLKESPEEVAQELLNMGTKLVVIKCGAEGSYASDGRQICQVPALPVSVFDAVGAGDNFDAGFIWGLRAGWPLQACLALGNSTSALYISRRTERFPRLAEVLKTVRESYDFIPTP
jgi:sugar/nucleoside kinase (ribokinase family)